MADPNERGRSGSAEQGAASVHRDGIVSSPGLSGGYVDAGSEEICIMKREFNTLSTTSFAASVSACFATITTTFIYPLKAGGSAAAVWCWSFSGLLWLCLAASVAELVSSKSNSGGVYTIVPLIAPERWSRSISWVVGWINLLGQAAGVAGVEYGAALIILAAAAILHEDYISTPGHTVAVAAALTVLHGILNSMPTGYLSKLTAFYIIIHFGALLACCIALLVMCKNRHDGAYVFKHVESVSGWRPTGFAFMFGVLSNSWTMTNFDATAHIANEVKRPRVIVPRSIMFAMVVTYVAGLFFTICLCVTMGDQTELLASPLKQPVIQLFRNVLGKSGGLAFAFITFIILNFCGMTALQALGRTIWAFSIDRLLPLSSVWRKEDRRSKTPIYAIWFSVVFCILINLIGLGSVVTIEAVFTICPITLNWSYVIPILCKLYTGRFKPGPWHLGRWSTTINVLACLWTMLTTIIFILPTTRPVKRETMNYSAPITCFVLLIAAAYWHFSGKHYYQGPQSHDESPDAGSTGEKTPVASDRPMQARSSTHSDNHTSSQSSQDDPETVSIKLAS